MITARITELTEIAPLRELYRAEMNCQIVHDNIHVRPGWTIEHALEIDGALAGYGSVAIAGPWKKRHCLYEFFVLEQHRNRAFDIFTTLRASCTAKTIETQSNAILLPVMLHAFVPKPRASAIVFKDAGFDTRLAPAGAAFRATTDADTETLASLGLDDSAGWLVTLDGEIAGAGGVLYHYNRPYGDVYMAVAERARRRGIGAYLVQELMRVCREGGSVPAARCNIDNLASRKTLQKAGFVPCAVRLEGNLPR